VPCSWLKSQSSPAGCSKVLPHQRERTGKYLPKTHQGSANQRQLFETASSDTIGGASCSQRITSAKPIPEAAIAQTHNPEAPNTYTEAAAALLREGAGKQPQVQTRSLCCSTKSSSSSPRGPHTVAVVSPPAMCCHLPSCSADAAECPNPSRRCSELPALLGELQSTGDIDASKPCCICLRPI